MRGRVRVACSQAAGQQRVRLHVCTHRSLLVCSQELRRALGWRRSAWILWRKRGRLTAVHPSNRRLVWKVLHHRLFVGTVRLLPATLQDLWCEEDAACTHFSEDDVAPSKLFGDCEVLPATLEGQWPVV